ncbi:hypothetical protein GGX14DRAFT_571040 [Mycena pura]|uniref:Uncharacterized protein n=1 Tax=Mycena pura TaxID=153505 RepID=A0AAD6YAE7_9AGAR|nr:hypothetical protein GGX14DRAFT_571040 [Mycena pura]
MPCLAPWPKLKPMGRRALFIVPVIQAVIKMTCPSYAWAGWAGQHRRPHHRESTASPVVVAQHREHMLRRAERNPSNACGSATILSASAAARSSTHDELTVCRVSPPTAYASDLLQQRVEQEATAAVVTPRADLGADLRDVYRRHVHELEEHVRLEDRPGCAQVITEDGVETDGRTKCMTHTVVVACSFVALRLARERHQLILRHCVASEASNPKASQSDPDVAQALKSCTTLSPRRTHDLRLADVATELLPEYCDSDLRAGGAAVKAHSLQAAKTDGWLTITEDPDNGWGTVPAFPGAAGEV